MGGCIGGSCVGGSCDSVTLVLATSGLEELLRAKWERRGIGGGKMGRGGRECGGGDRESGRQIKTEVVKRAVGRERRKEKTRWEVGEEGHLNHHYKWFMSSKLVTMGTYQRP